MSGINLLPKEVQKGQSFTAYQRTAYAITSVALVLYIVVTCGIVGWWLFLAHSGSQVSAETQDITNQISQLAQSEQTARQLHTRGATAQQFLQGRTRTSDLATQLLVGSGQLAVTSWDYTAGGIQTLTVTAVRAGDIEIYAETMAKSYSVLIDQLTQLEDQTWIAEITLTPLETQ